MMCLMKKALLYIHGKNGGADEAEHYKPLVSDYDVIGLNYQSSTPWEAKSEFSVAYNHIAEKYEHIGLIANSVGAYFALNALSDADIERAFFISPIVNMEKLITDMMHWADITEPELKQKQEIATSFGETLSWKYLCYVRKHPINWAVPTDILYGEGDNLTSMETISSFAEHYKASLTVMKGGEHWFHTAEQMQFLDNWLIQCLKKDIRNDNA